MSDLANREEPAFEGLKDRECGEHRTTGYRAWCFNCSEWCSPTLPCRGCELPKLRASLIEKEERLLALERAARRVIRSRYYQAVTTGRAPADPFVNNDALEALAALQSLPEEPGE